MKFLNQTDDKIYPKQHITQREWMIISKALQDLECDAWKAENIYLSLQGESIPKSDIMNLLIKIGYMGD